VVTSILLKYGDAGLAMLAAERSVLAARRSAEPLTMASSARAVTHAMMSNGHYRLAVDLAVQAAKRLDTETRLASPAAVSVYGALLLRGATAAARDDDQARTENLLNEADAAARQVAANANFRWTAFEPTNVQQHRVTTAVALGDAGRALRHARDIDRKRIYLAERRARLHIDVATAYAQRNAFGESYQALRAAERAAPEEVRTRPAVRRLIADLYQRAPRAVRHDLEQLAQRVGATQ
jgi:hypothetical protein